MENFKFIGYIDNEVIANGFLIPLFQEISSEKIYTVKMISKNPEIDFSKSIELEKYKNDNVVVISDDAYNNCNNNPLDLIVYKIENKVYLNSYENSSRHLLGKLNNNEISSSILCEYILKIFDKVSNSNSLKDNDIVPHQRRKRNIYHRHARSIAYRSILARKAKYGAVKKTKKHKKSHRSGLEKHSRGQV